MRSGIKYLNLLAISDHLTECKLKYEAYKLDSINKKSYTHGPIGTCRLNFIL